MKKKLLTFFLCLGGLCVCAQNTIGLPHIFNYTNEQTNAGTQTWGMAQDKKGIIYFANNDGLLTFNGKYWKVHQVPNKTIVRSVAIDSVSGKIYVGAQGELGYFYPDNKGELVYHSLVKYIPESSKSFADIWNIVFFDNAVFFRANDRIFQFKNENCTVYNAFDEWLILAKVSGRLLAQDKTKGLVEWAHNSWEIVCSTGEMQISSILDYNADTALVTTNKKGLFLLQLQKNTLTKLRTDADNAWATERIYAAQKINKDWFALGTTSGGCYIISITGKIIQRLTKAEGIQNNNILNLFLDKDQNLWLGLDNGIDFVAYNSAVKHIYPDKQDQPSGYAIKIFDSNLYIGTSNGLYYAPLNLKESDLSFSKGNFLHVANAAEQIWELSEVNGQLLMGHHEGVSVVNKNKAASLSTGQGVWLFTPMSSTAPSQDVLLGDYTGLELLEFKNNRFSYSGKVDGVSESFRFLAIDSGNAIWTSHPYRGVFKIILSPDKKKVSSATLYGKKDGLPSDLSDYIYKIKNNIVVATEKGVYEYNRATNKFAPSAMFEPIFKQSAVQYLAEDSTGNIWFVADRRIGVIDFHKKKENTPYAIVYFPELTGNIVYGFIHIYPYNQENIFIGGNKGVYHINYSKYIASQSVSKPNVLLDAVKVINKKDSIIYGGHPNGAGTASFEDENNIVGLPNNYNSFHFEYSSTLYAQLSNIEFSYQLEGFDKTWSDWSSKTEKDYTNLSYGAYTFKVKARNNLGNESAPAFYMLKVLPAWYQTGWAYLAYLAMAITGIFFLSKNQEKKFAMREIQYREEQKKLRYLHQLELDRNEKEIVKLQNDKLETEVHFKNKQLASATMHLVERGKLISKLKEELANLLKRPDNLPVKNEFKDIMRMLADAEKSDEDWEHFSIHFDQVHSNFLTNLKTKFPQLSATDLKLCAYLRINLSSKEIAQLMNISLKGVEISRYRLRKKLEIPTEINLYDFLIQAGNQALGTSGV
jgi:ligand-binding sensor domain-containing protein/DNA-binding CsgD family transcriptional regulator